MSASTQTGLNLDHCDVVNVRVTAPQRLTLRFRDGLVAELDFADFITAAPGDWIAPLREPEYFAKVTIDEGVLRWPNEFDLDPVNLRSWAERGYCG